MASRTYEERIYGELTATYTRYHKLKIIYKNHEYMEASRTATHIWMRCTCQKELKCQARLKISLEEPFIILGQSNYWHNHMPKHDAQLLADAALRMMVAEAAATTESYASIHARCLSALLMEVRKFVKTLDQCKDAMRRSRKKHGRYEPASLNELVLEGVMRETIDGEDFFLLH